MRVTRLEIFGFKSFVERFTLNFDHKMIGIVGPNGCGKSNVVDALRWVLGETHAKHLRGTVLEDLIFNGSDSRRALGMAEVSITIRPHEGWSELTEAPVEGDENILQIADNLEVDAVVNEDSENKREPILEKDIDPKAILQEIPGLLGASEIQFTRRLYRSGESEYFINRVPCRLRDMVEVYRLIGLGARGLSIVQQGEIGQLISKKPIERRELLEEAAGISGFRTRMEIAHRKLEKTTENMSRLKDIILEVEKQVRVLQRQAKRASERNEVKSELKQYELNHFIARSAQVLIEQKENISLQNKLSQEQGEISASLEKLDATHTSLQSKISEFDHLIIEKRRKKDELQNIINAEQSRINNLKLKLASSEGKIEEVSKNLMRIESAKLENGKEIQDSEFKLGSLSSELESVEQRKANLAEELKSLQQVEEERKNTFQLELPEILNSMTDISLNEEIQKLNLELEQMPQIEGEIRSLQQELSVLNNRAKEETSALQAARLKIASAQSEVNSIERQIEALAEQVVKSASDNTSDVLNSSKGINKVLLAGIKISEDLQKAVAAILGEKAQYLLTDDLLALSESFSKKRMSGSVDGLRVGVIDQRFSKNDSGYTELSTEELNLAPSARRLIEQIEIEEKFKDVVNYFLGDYILVNSLEEGVKLNDFRKTQNLNGRFIVTNAGEVVSPWGWYSTSGKGQAFSFTRRVAEQKELLLGLNADAENLETQVQETEQKLSSLKQNIADKTTLRERMFDTQRRLLRLKHESQVAEQKLRDTVVSEERKRQQQVLVEERALQGRLMQAVSELENCKSKVRYEERKIEDLKKQLQNIDSQNANMTAEKEKLAAEREALKSDLATNEVSAGKNIYEIQEQCNALEAELRNVETTRDPLTLELAENFENLAKSRRETNALQEQLNKLNLSVEKAQFEVQMLYEDICRSYPETPEISEQDIEVIQAEAKGNIPSLISSLQENATKLRRKIEREGEVDPQSIEMYEQENERLQNLKTQYEDLETASETLNKTVIQLKQVSRARFLETFTFVNSKFKELLPRLFGGGAGHLELINADDPLESGVEIYVRPPGKKISNMELLSGGEKALVAVSVLLSMFLFKPSPICVLDEVDAPLDEANLERYLGLIKEISAGTQFLVITHNKRTMAEASRLIGITMQEKGVTTALSVTLEDSEEEIDKWVANA